MADELYGIERLAYYRQHHLRIPTDVKLNQGIRLSIYDAASDYKRRTGSSLGLRAILREPEFRNAWRTFRGGGIRGGTPSTLSEKMKAAEVFGWSPPRRMALERLRNVSP